MKLGYQNLAWLPILAGMFLILVAVCPSLAQESAAQSECGSPSLVVVGPRKPRTDGYYVESEGLPDAYRRILRFYPDGTVVGASLQRTAWTHERGFYRSLNNWLTNPLSKEVKNGREYMLGRYKCNGSSIRFGVLNVEFSGVIQHDGLLLQGYSPLNRYAFSEDRFEFHSIE